MNFKIKTSHYKVSFRNVRLFAMLNNCISLDLKLPSKIDHRNKMLDKIYF